MKPDPPTRKDGRCRVCQGRRGALPKVKTQVPRDQLIANLAADPFCSSTCCRKWHGTQLDAHPEKAQTDTIEWTHA